MFLTLKLFFGSKCIITPETTFLARVTFTAPMHVSSILFSRDSGILHRTTIHYNSGNNTLIIFGGMSNRPNPSYTDELCVLNDIRFFDLSTRHWLPAETPPSIHLNRLLPPARYGHLSSITGSKLFVIGGQDLLERWLDDICVFDLVTRTWIQRRDYPRHCGTYRSVAVASHLTVRFPQHEKQMSQSESIPVSAENGFRLTKNTSKTDATPSKSLIHQPYSAVSTEDHPSDVLLYNNYNVGP